MSGYSDYWKSVQDTYDEAFQEWETDAKEDPHGQGHPESAYEELRELVERNMDGAYYDTEAVIEHTNNLDELYEIGIEPDATTWQGLKEQFAAWAFRADLMERMHSSDDLEALLDEWKDAADASESEEDDDEEEAPKRGFEFLGRRRR